MTQIDPQSTGTGVIDSFVRIQQTGNESGYNTDISTFGTPLNTMGGGFTTPLLLADVPIVMIDGVAYREFLLDINQTLPGALLSLNQIQIFQSAAPLGNETVSATTTPVISFAGATEVFRMNTGAYTGTGGGGTTIQLNYALNAGSGSGDMFLYVLNSSFTGGGALLLSILSLATLQGPAAATTGSKSGRSGKGPRRFQNQRRCCCSEPAWSALLAPLAGGPVRPPRRVDRFNPPL